MRRPCRAWLATLVILAHVLAPGMHALQLRIEQQRGEVVRLCCMAGNAAPTRGRDPEPTKVELRHARLVACDIGRLLLAGHDYVPAATAPPRKDPDPTAHRAVTLQASERDGRPEHPPARAPPA